MDILDTVVCLKNSSKGNCEIDDLSFEVHFEKTRGVREEGNRPFIAKMTSYSTFRAQYVYFHFKNKGFDYIFW